MTQKDYRRFDMGDVLVDGEATGRYSSGYWAIADVFQDDTNRVTPAA